MRGRFYDEVTFGRTNARGKDQNRNFPDQFWDAKLLVQGDHQSMYRGREQERVAAMKWIVGNPFVLSGESHGMV